MVRCDAPVPLSEPTTLVSNWVLAAVAVGLGVRLYRAGTGEGLRAQRLWAAAFLAGAAAALAGGVVHGFAASLTPARPHRVVEDRARRRRRRRAA